MRLSLFLSVADTGLVETVLFSFPFLANRIQFRGPAAALLRTD